MLEPDVYLDDALESQRLRNSFKFARQTPNFQKLNNERMLIPITLHVQVNPTFVIKDHFDWDLSDQHKNPDLFAEKLAAALGLTNPEEISHQIYEQIIDHVEKYTVQTRTRIPRRLEDHTTNLTCLNCDSILYSNDICRACGVSLEKLRQKYGQLNILAPEVKGDDDEGVTVRQTERQKNLESLRRKLDSSLGGGNKRLCARCGEANHCLSVECRQCSKPLNKAYPVYRTRKIKQVSEALAHHLWKALNKESQFAQLAIMSDMLKEEDFSSPLKLKAKLQALLDNSLNPPVSASPSKVRLMQEYLQATYEKTIVAGSPAGLLVTKPQEFECDLKELDAGQIHVTAYTEAPPMMQVYQRHEDPNRYMRYNDAGRRRGRPRKYPLPGMSRDYLDADEIPAKVKGEDDNSMMECGICSEPGDLICCEVCPSVYHLHCLELDQVPKGRWMCFFCRIVKDGFNEAMKERSVFSDDLTKLMQASEGWQNQALQVMDILMMHPCSKDMKAPTPKPDIPPEDLVSLREMVVQGQEYTSLERVDAQVRKIWKHTQKNCKRNSTLYYQAFNMQLFHNKMVSELQELVGLPLVTQPINAPKSESDPVKIQKLA